MWLPRGCTRAVRHMGPSFANLRSDGVRSPVTLRSNGLWRSTLSIGNGSTFVSSAHPEARLVVAEPSSRQLAVGPSGRPEAPACSHGGKRPAFVDGTPEAGLTPPRVLIDGFFFPASLGQVTSHAPSRCDFRCGDPERDWDLACRSRIQAGSEIDLRSCHARIRIPTAGPDRNFDLDCQAGAPGTDFDLDRRHSPPGQIKIPIRPGKGSGSSTQTRLKFQSGLRQGQGPQCVDRIEIPIRTGAHV